MKTNRATGTKHKFLVLGVNCIFLGCMLGFALGCLVLPKLHFAKVWSRKNWQRKYFRNFHYCLWLLLSKIFSNSSCQTERWQETASTITTSCFRDLGGLRKILEKCALPYQIYVIVLHGASVPAFWIGRIFAMFHFRFGIAKAILKFATLLQKDLPKYM